MAITWLAIDDEPAISVTLERIDHGHCSAALLDSKRGIGLCLISVDVHQINAHIHRGHVDAAVVAHVVDDRLTNLVSIAA